MTTGELPGAPPVAVDAATPELAQQLAKQLEQLANQYFSGGPGAVTSVPAASPGEVSLRPGDAAPIAPPRLGPHAANLGAGGASAGLSAPPIPGPVHRPPLAATPPPKESDLRALPTLASEQLGLGSPIALASATPSSDGTPYFLALAGLPGTGAIPAVDTSHVTQAPSSAPAFPASPGVPVASSSAPLPAVGAVPQPEAPSSSFGALPASSSLGGIELVPASVASVDRSRRPFDPHAIKRDFPILRERVHGRELVWLDNAATTQKPQVVIDRVSHFYEHENSNIHRAAHTLAARATDAYESARESVRRFLGAATPKEIVFVRGATEGINLVAQSWGRRHVSAGDEIVITWLEHHANIVPWQQLCAEKGARLRVAPVDDRGQILLDEYEKLLGPRTRLVSLTQVSNALGSITPARDMVAMAHRHGAHVLVDGAQAVSHMPVDVQSLDCDFYVLSGHKVFGPTGIGVVYGKSAVLEAMPPWQGGGNMIADVTFEKTIYQPPPARFEAGTGNIADAVGLGAALDYLTGLGLENVQRYEHELLAYAEERLARVPGLHLVGAAAEKAGVISFVLDGQRTEEVGGLLDREGIAVRSGHHCAQPILRRMGLEATVRASLAPYNTEDDVDALVAALRRLQAGVPVRR